MPIKYLAVFYFMLTSCSILLAQEEGMFARKSSSQSRISEQQAKSAAQAQQLQTILFSIQSLSDQITALDQNQNALLARISALEARQNSISHDEITALRRDLDSVMEEQKTLRVNIVNDLTKKISSLTAQPKGSAETKEIQTSGEYYEHIVASGQTMSQISTEYKVPLKTIMNANNIKDASKIRVGQKLIIPVLK